MADSESNVIVAGINDNRSRGDQAVAQINNLINRMTSLLDTISSVQSISTELGNVTATVDAYVRPPAPVRPAIDTTFPAAPGLAAVIANFPTATAGLAINPAFGRAPAKPAIIPAFPPAPALVPSTPAFPAAPAAVTMGAVAALVIDPVPQLTAAEPVLNTIAAPARFTKAAPVMAALPERSYPDKPANNLPAAPVLRTLTLPAAPALLDLTFAGILPDPLDAPPDVSFTFTETEYQSLLNDELKDKLLALVLNTAQTGLNPAIEQQIWDRARERTSALTKGLIDSISRQYARSGWTMPTGDQAERVFQAMEIGVEADMTESRSIAASQADLEQKNFQFAFTQALALEGTLLNQHNAVQQRTFEAAKYVIEAAINLYQVKASYFNAGVTLYTAQSQVYRDRLQAELTKLELFKAELEGQKLIGELNRQDLDNYHAQIDAVVAIFGLYSTELQAVKTQLEGDGLKVQQFEALIRAFSEELHAKSLEYDGYKAEWSGEEIKANVYNSLAGAFGKRIEAFSSVNDAKIKKLDADVKINLEVPLQIAEQRIKVFVAETEAESKRLEANNAINETATKIFSARNTAEEARVKAETAIYSTDADVFKAINAGEASRLEALNESNKTTNDGFKTRVEAESERLKAMTESNASVTEIYKSQVQARGLQVNALTDIYKTDGAVFGELANAEGTRVNSQVEILKQQLDTLVQRANVRIEAMKANIATFLSQKELVLGTLKTIAQVEAQLVASFGSAVNYSAGISASTSVGMSTSSSQSSSQTQSIGESHSTSTSDVTTHSG